MKGLILKDLFFMLQQKKMFLIPLCIFIPFVIFQGAESAPFVISYMTLFGGILAISSLSYDEYDGSMAFLMTLPVTRKEYVFEKYIFSLGGSLLFWAVATMFYLILYASERAEILIAGLVLSLMLTGFQMIMLPVQLKYGGDKGRMVLIGIVAFIMIGAYGLKVIGERLLEMPLVVLLENMIEKIASAGIWAAGGVTLAIWCIALVISIAVSTKIMEKKEF